MRIKLVLAVSVTSAVLLVSGYALGYWQGSPVNIVVQAPDDCAPPDREPPLF